MSPARISLPRWLIGPVTPTGRCGHERHPKSTYHQLESLWWPLHGPDFKSNGSLWQNTVHEHSPKIEVVMAKLESVRIPATASIQDAFHQLNSSGMGILFAEDSGFRIIGCVTDGDIRRQLLDNGDLTVSLSAFMNTKFVWARAGTSREQILKLLDHRVHFVPILDDDRQLVDICSREEFAADAESEVFVRGRAPARITFGGGEQTSPISLSTRAALSLMRRLTNTRTRPFAGEQIPPYGSTRTICRRRWRPHPAQISNSMVFLTYSFRLSSWFSPHSASKWKLLPTSPSDQVSVGLLPWRRP